MAVSGRLYTQDYHILYSVLGPYTARQKLFEADQEFWDTSEVDEMSYFLDAIDHLGYAITS